MGSFWSSPPSETQEVDDSSSSSSVEEEAQVTSITQASIERRFSGGKALPLNVENKASELVENMPHAELYAVTTSTDDKYLLVRQLHRKRGRPHPDEHWELIEQEDDLKSRIRDAMHADGVGQMDSLRELCARYPGYFYNLAWRCEKNVDSMMYFIRGL
jgi:hypothetical protein